MKLVTRPPATAKPSQNDGGRVLALRLDEHQLSRPTGFVQPFMTAALKPPPMVVELVIGKRTGPLGDVDLDVDDGFGAVAGGGNAGVRKRLAIFRRLRIRRAGRAIARE